MAVDYCACKLIPTSPNRVALAPKPTSFLLAITDNYADIRAATRLVRPLVYVRVMVDIDDASMKEDAISDQPLVVSVSPMVAENAASKRGAKK